MERKYDYLHVVQGYYVPHGWEDLTQSEDRKTAVADARAYRENADEPVRIIRRRELRHSEELYDRLLAAGCTLANHESDLYVLRDDTALAILREAKATWTVFRGAIDGKPWIDVPFMFAPFWRNVQARGKA